MTPKPRSENSRYEFTAHEGIRRVRIGGTYYLRDTLFVGDDLTPIRVERSLKTKNITEALDRAKRIKAKITKGHVVPGKGKERHTFTEVFELLRKVQSTKADKTYTSTLTQINHLEPFFCGQKADPSKGLEEMPARCLYLDDFERDYEGVWVDYQNDGKRRRPGVKFEHDRRTLVQALKRAYNKRSADGASWLSREFTKKDFELNEASEPIGQFIEDKEVKKLLGALWALAERMRAQLEARQKKLGAKFVEPSYWFPERAYLQVLIAVTMGMRKKEILHTHRDEINLRKREIDPWARRIKTRQKRVTPIPISDDVYPLLVDALDAAPGPFLFPKILMNVEGRPVKADQPQDDNSAAWDEVREETGIEVRFHDLRHTAITNLIEAGIPSPDIQNMLGVSEQTMRRIYAHLKTKTKERFRSVFAGRFTGGTVGVKQSNNRASQTADEEKEAHG